MRRWPALFAMFFLTTAAFAQTLGDAAPVKAALFLSVDQLAAGAKFRLAVGLDVPPPWHINANPAAPDFLVPTSVTFEAPESITMSPVTYPTGTAEKLSWADEPVRLYTGRTLLFATGQVRADAPRGPVTITANVQYQACDNKRCLKPVTVTVTLQTSIADHAAPANAEIFRAAPPLATAVTEEQSNAVARFMSQHGLWLTLVFLFFGGLALNLTPCVYPMIAITVSYFGARDEQRAGRAFGSALTYFFGIVLTYSTVGLVVARTGALFGAVLQSPVVLIGVGAMLVALALSLFGLYELQPPAFLIQKAAGLSAKAGYVGLFFLGATVGVIAAPCLAPILVALLTYVGQKANPWLGWWMFFALSSGLGAPYIVLGSFSGLLGRLPKSGTWMVWVKRVLGVVLLGVTFWIVRPLWAHSEAKLGEPFTREKLAQAASAQRPVVIDFSATWCGPCREMDRETFADPRVIAKARQFVFLRADVTRAESPDVSALMKEFAVRGVPTIVFLGPNGHEHVALRRTEKVGAYAFLKLMEQSLAPAPTNAPAATAAPDIPAKLLNPF